MIPDSISKALARARLHEEALEWRQAEEIYRRLLADHPRFHPALQAWGLLAFRAGNLPLAVELFRAAIGIDAGVGIYYRNYGEINRRLGKFDEAVKAGRQACRLLPLDVDAHFNLALALTDVRDSAGADATYRKVVELQAPADGAQVEMVISEFKFTPAG